MKIGIIGGIGPESTIDYYRSIIEAYRDKTSDDSYPEIIIVSIDMNKMLGMVESEDWEKLIDYLSDAIQSAYRAGADFAIIASNTAHIVFAELRTASPINLLSIVEETRKKVEALGLKRIGLFGTRFTTQSDFYQEECKGHGISVIVPTSEEQEYIHNKLMSEIELGITTDETRDGLLAIAKRMIDQDSIEALTLGCTELPLILKNNEFGIQFLNTAQIHVEATVNYMLQTLKSLNPLKGGIMSQIYRAARKEEAAQLARMDSIASGGLLEFLLHDLIPDLAPEQIFASFLENDEGPISYRNAVVCELDGNITGMALSYSSTYHVIDDEMRAFIPADRLKYVEDLFEANIEGTLFLDALYVEEQYRRMGIGTALLGMTIEKAKRQGFYGVSLDVLADNIRAIRLYERNGFKIVRHIEMSRNEYIPHDGGAYLMQYEI